MGVGLGLKGGALISPTLSLASPNLPPERVRQDGYSSHAASHEHSHSTTRHAVTAHSDVQTHATHARGGLRGSSTVPHPLAMLFSASSSWERVGRKVVGKGTRAGGLCWLPDEAAFRRAWEPMPPAPASRTHWKRVPIGRNGAVLVPGRSGR